MVKQQPVVYMTHAFFLTFVREIDSITINTPIEKRKKLLLLEELLFYKSTVYIDLNNADFDYYMQPSFQPKNKNEETFYYYFQILVNQNRVGRCSSTIEYFRQKQYQQFDKLQTKPNYVFLSETEEFCNEVAEEFGVICFSKQLDYNIDLFEVIKRTAKRNVEINLSRSNNFIDHLPFSHTIEIVDPYLLEQNVQFIVELIKSLAATNVQISLTIKVKNNKGRNIGHIEQTICQSIKNIKNSPFIKDERFFHNRKIKTNTFYLLSDYGFMRQYTNDNANWITFPLNKQ